MAEWKEVVEDGRLYWINEEYGNVLKLKDDMYIAMMPKVIKLGPFETIEQAQQVLEENKEAVDKVLDNLNHNLVTLTKQAKEG